MPSSFPSPLMDAFDDDDVTAQYCPDPALLRRARIGHDNAPSSSRQAEQEPKSDSGVSVIPRLSSAPIPSRRIVKPSSAQASSGHLSSSGQQASPALSARPTPRSAVATQARTVPMSPPPRQPLGGTRTISLQQLRNLRDEYNNYVGPAARLILLRQIAELGATAEAFPFAYRNQLITALAARLDDPDSCEHFIKAALNIVEEL